MIPSSLCYVPLSVEFWGPTAPQVFKPGPTTRPIFKPEWHPCICLKQLGTNLLIIGSDDLDLFYVQTAFLCMLCFHSNLQSVTSDFQWYTIYSNGWWVEILVFSSVNSNAGLLQPTIISVYVMYLTWSALLSVPAKAGWFVSIFSFT